jgi:monoamine oxidase
MKLDRRQLLAGLAASAGGAALAQPLPSNPDVVVVGAGSAGLAAALRLRALGRSVVVLEAMNRVGGRAWTDTETFGVPFDQGCAWIHAADRNPYTAYARAQGFTLQAHDYDLERVWYGSGRSPLNAASVNAAEAAMVDAIGKLKGDRPASLAVQARTPVEQAAATYLGPMDFAVDLDELSSADYSAADDLDPNFLVREGYGSVVARLGREVPVRLSTPARRIRWGGRGVTVETDAGALQARAVLVTASTGALQAETVRFDPPLPVAKQTAIHDVPMGMLVKIPLLVPRERFGVAPFTDVMLERYGKRDIYFLSFPFDYDLVVGFAGGDFGWELSAAGETAAVDFAKEALADIFGSTAPGKVARGAMTRWASNPWTRGAYAAAAPGRFAARAVLAEPVAERVFFAGEALAGPLVQTCGGAYLSGQRTADAVHAALSRT